MKLINCKVSKVNYTIELEYSGAYDYDELMKLLNKKYHNNIYGLYIIDILEPKENDYGCIFGKVKFVDLDNNFFLTLKC